MVPRQRTQRQRGFTLIEAVVVIMMIGVVAAMVGSFIRRPIDAYTDQARRAALSDAADMALRRISRDVAQALPNSLRIDATGTRLEMLPVSAAGRYRMAAGTAAGELDPLETESASDTSFQLLGPPVDVASGDQLVIYNLGISGADAYAGDNRRTLSSLGTGLSTLTFTGTGSPFPFDSPGARFHIVNTPVTLACSPSASTTTGALQRLAGYAIQSTQPTDLAAAPLAALSGRSNSLLADHVSACSFSFSSGNAQRTGILTLSLTLTDNGESVTLLHQMLVSNTP
jgi:MSHA biogenesis protein MshO